LYHIKNKISTFYAKNKYIFKENCKKRENKIKNIDNKKGLNVKVKYQAV
jgi:hypothetical protein